jgi:hypothetical protein
MVLWVAFDTARVPSREVTFAAWVGAPLTAGAAAGLGTGLLLRALGSRPSTAALTLAGAGASVPLALALASGWAWFLFWIPGLVATVALLAWAAPRAARATWPRSGAGRGAFLVGASLAVAVVPVLILTADPLQDTALIVFERADGAPYEPFDLGDASASDPAPQPESLLASLERHGAARMYATGNNYLPGFLARFGYEELAAKSLAAGVEPPRFFVRYHGLVYEYTVTFEPDAVDPLARQGV